MTMSHNTWKTGTDKNAAPQKKTQKAPAKKTPVKKTVQAPAKKTSPPPAPERVMPKPATPAKSKDKSAASGKKTLVGEPPKKRASRTVRVMRSSLPPPMSVFNPAFFLDDLTK